MLIFCIVSKVRAPVAEGSEERVLLFPCLQPLPMILYEAIIDRRKNTGIENLYIEIEQVNVD